MSIWKQVVTVDWLEAKSKGTLMETLGIEYLEVGDDFLKARMPVDRRTKQPFGILHGGASVALAETVGTMAAFLCVDPDTKRTVGLEINANHVRPVTEGWVTGIAKPLHLGRTTQVWEIRIFNDQQKLTCISRHTVAIIDKP
jgi:1,4-dihydroxy-2-naphthoyl-CoA hydrolase